MSSTLATFYSGWERHNQLLEQAISPLDAAQLSLQASPDIGSIRMIANHIVGARAWWFSSWMGEGGTELARFPGYDDEDGAELRDAATIVSALGQSWACLAASLSSWTEDDLAQQFQRPRPYPNGDRPSRTRQYIIWHVVEHDLHHGGEISLTLGMHGLTGLGV